MNIYRPGEDSVFLKDHVEKLVLEGKKFLDMGTGTGIIGISAAKKQADVTSADINPDALRIAAEKAGEEDVSDRITFVESDLFENIEGKFDFIAFNPPYLPGDMEDERLIGGEQGTELTEIFLEQADNHLKDGGEILLIGSSLADIEGLIERYNLETVESKKLWFETLYLLRYK